MQAVVHIVLCRKNCSGSPHCLNGLGEKKWLTATNDPVMCSADVESLKVGEVRYKTATNVCTYYLDKKVINCLFNCDQDQLLLSKITSYC